MANVMDRTMFAGASQPWADEPLRRPAPLDGFNVQPVTSSNRLGDSTPMGNATAGSINQTNGIATLDAARPTPRNIDTRQRPEQEPVPTPQQQQPMGDGGSGSGRVSTKTKVGIETTLPMGEPVDYEKELGDLVSDKPYSNWDY